MKIKRIRPFAYLLAATLFCAAAAQAALITITKIDPATANFGDLSANNYNLSTLGTTDWTIWGAASLTPSERMNGGSGIGALAYDDSSTTVKGFGSSATGRNPLYSWSNGTSVTAHGGADFNVLTSANDPAVGNGGTGSTGQTFTLTVDADTKASQLYLWLGAQNSFFDIDATLTGGTSQTLNVGTSANNPDMGLFRIDFTADNASDLLTVDLVKTAVSGGNVSNFGIQAAALTVVPEPATLSLIASAGLALMLWRRRARC